MAASFKAILALSMLISPCLSSAAQSCSSYTFSSNKVFSSCTELPHLGASLYYNHTAPTDTISIAFKAPQTSTGWVAWGLNPAGTKMVGSQAIVAFFHSNGSMVAYPTQLDSYAPSMAPGAPSFPVSDLSTEYVNKEMIIFATLGLVGGGSKFSHVWQEGSTVLNDVPKAHSTTGENIQSLGTIDFQ
ncbi:cytochrome b561 and DOMON domain-containing protein At5g47530-like [Phoenix dactylifera]|uniref:Cytochrome b561 and DOMON domain-containing protein At5g47530-like n=1 Tax=Phoenix dactylifera TaxID=42345 RepID=A0A8B7BQ86_PHODC|nr:cytochrome b561 and DOMON domain-containing protein At5g47530-like [Phoenix dactylifera]